MWYVYSFLPQVFGNLFIWRGVCVCVSMCIRLVGPTQGWSCLTLCDPMDSSAPQTTSLYFTLRSWSMSGAGTTRDSQDILGIPSKVLNVCSTLARSLASVMFVSL